MRNETNTDQDAYIELRVQADELTFIPSGDSGSGQNHHSSLSSVRKVLAQYGVTEAGLENAINQVEDMIMPIIRALPECVQLKVSGSELENVFPLLPVTSGPVVSIELVESLYKELEGYAAGSPVAWRHDVSPDDVALGLVVIREVMHHGGFRSVSMLVHTE
jgi:hypothetical protein